MLIARIAVIAWLLVSSRAEAALTRVTTFGSNPGALAMYEYVPAGLATGRPLVLVLHGCTQTAADMEKAGWNTLADEHDFAVVYPEQQTANNSVRCFNWAGEFGDPTNLVRGQGENASILSMIESAVTRHGSNPARVYIVGFSAGGAFAAVMLATHPERFAGAAIMSGLPYRCATTVNGAFSCQSPGVTRTAPQWGDLVRAAYSHSGARAPIQIWHGASDTIVVPANHGELVKQWSNVFGTDDIADETETIGNTTRTVYKAGTNNVVIEAFRVTGMGHATAVGGAGCPSTAGSYFEDRGICSTARAAAFFNLAVDPGGPDAIAPSVAIVSPATGDTVTGQVTIVVAANDETAMDSVTLAIDGTEVGTDAEPPFQFTWDATAAGPGEHALEATATDAAGNVSSAIAMVTVPGEGDGSGSGSGSNTDEPGPNTDLPGCSLDATGGGAGFATLAFGLVLVIARRRRRSMRG
jgi:poly(hydroxyalkanoate) depolymerase family esterase